MKHLVLIVDTDFVNDTNLLQYASNADTLLSKRSWVDRLSGGCFFAAVLVLGAKLLVKQGHFSQHMVHYRVIGSNTNDNLLLDALHFVSGGPSIGNLTLLDAFVLILCAASFGVAIWRGLRINGKIPSGRRTLMLSGSALIVSTLSAGFSWPTVEYVSCIW